MACLVHSRPVAGTPAGYTVALTTTPLQCICDLITIPFNSLVRSVIRLRHNCYITFDYAITILSDTTEIHFHFSAVV